MINMKIYVTATCHIRNSILRINGSEVFESKGFQLNDFLLQCYDHLKINYPKFYKMDRLSKLGFLASEALLQDRNNEQLGSAAVILANANASLDTDIEYLKSTKINPSPSLFVYTLPNIVAGEICIRHGINGENAFFVMPEFDSTFFTDYISMVMQQPNINMCIAGWVDVLDEHYDVFLYLAEKTEEGLSLLHTAEKVNELYT